MTEWVLPKKESPSKNVRALLLKSIDDLPIGGTTIDFICRELNETIVPVAAGSSNAQVFYLEDTFLKSKNGDGRVINYQPIKFISCGLSTFSTTFTSIATFPSIGDLSGLTEINVYSAKNSAETFTYTIRLFDLTNQKVICENTFSNLDYQKNNMGPLYDLPITDTILEVHCKLSTANEFGVLFGGLSI